MNTKDPQQSRPNDQPLNKGHISGIYGDNGGILSVKKEPQTKMGTNLPYKIPEAQASETPATMTSGVINVGG